jgi:hypothetical protein
MIMNNEVGEKTYFKVLLWNFVGGAKKVMDTLSRLMVSG